MRGHLFERRPGVWLLRVDIGPDPLTGKRRQVARTVEGTKREAEAALAQLQVEANNGRLRQTNVTLDGLIDQWLDHAGPRLAPITLSEYRRYAAQRIGPALGSKRLSRISVHDLDRFYTALGASGLGPKSVRNIHSMIHKAFDQAIRWGWCVTNPAVMASLPTVHRTRRRPMKITELNKILIAADEFDPDFGCLLRVIVATGARRGELCALRWTDIDLAAGTILIARSITTVGKAEKSTKSHAERRLSIDAGTVAVLGEHLDRVVDRCTAAGISFPVHGFVFSFHLDGSVPYHPDSVTQRFSRLRERVGLERGMRLHDLRHAHASLLLDAGVPLATVSERLGHANPHTTLVIYTHGVSEGDRRASATFGDLLDDGDDDSTGEDPDTIEPG